MDKLFNMDSIRIVKVLEYENERYLSLNYRKLISSYVLKILKPWFKKNFKVDISRFDISYLVKNFCDIFHSNSKWNDNLKTIEDYISQSRCLDKPKQQCYKEFKDSDFHYPLFKVFD